MTVTGTIRLVLLITLLAPALAAHRLDEYLQNTLLLIAPDHVSVEVNLTPGIQTFPAFFTLVDRDRDGQLSPAEQQDYALRVLEDLSLEIDRQSRTLALTGVRFPPLEDLRAGLGTVRLNLRAQFRTTSDGEHELHFRNSHQRSTAVYAINALVPPRGIDIIRQQRDQDQTEIRVTYRLGPALATLPSSAAGSPWTLAGGLGLVALLLTLAERKTRRDQPKRTSPEEVRS